MEAFPLYTRIYKNLAAVPDAGSFDNISLEQIMAFKPDLIIASVTSAKGNEKIKQLGIPVVTVGTGRTDIELLLKEFKMMGEILGAEKRASELVGYWEEKLSQIQKNRRLTRIE